MGKKENGCNSIQSAKKLLKEKLVNPDVSIEQRINPEEDKIYVCSCCGKKYKRQVGNFSQTNSVLYKGNNGYVTVCRSCSEKYYAKLIELYSNNEDAALEHMCWLFDWYYSPEAAEMAKKSGGNTAFCTAYPGKMNMYQIKLRGTTYLDTIKEQAVNKVQTTKQIEQVKEFVGECADDAEAKELIDFFGAGYSPDEYAFLYREYKEWDQRYDIRTKAQENIFKQICCTQLLSQKALQSNKIAEYNTLMKTMQDLYSSANIKPSQNKLDSELEEETFGTLIKKVEDFKPIEHSDEDVDELKKLVDVFFVGHLCEALHVDNDNSEQYREEMAKYTVTPPVDDGKGDDITTDILDRGKIGGTK